MRRQPGRLFIAASCILKSLQTRDMDFTADPRFLLPVLMEAFRLLSRGGARFDKKRFQSDVKLFDVRTPLRCLPLLSQQGLRNRRPRTPSPNRRKNYLLNLISSSMHKTVHQNERVVSWIDTTTTTFNVKRRNNVRRGRARSTKMRNLLKHRDIASRPEVQISLHAYIRLRNSGSDTIYPRCY
jgi:hypothetical protein